MDKVKMRVRFGFVCLLFLLGLGLLGNLTPETNSSPSYGITSDATYYYVESENIVLWVRKADGLMQYFIGGKNWTSTKGYGGINVIKKGVGYNDDAAPPYHFGLTPFPHPLTQISQNNTHLSYKQVKASSPTMRLYVDIQAKPLSIEVLFKLENLDAVVHGYTLSLSMWIYQSNMKQVFPYDSILEQNRANYTQINLFTGEVISRDYTVGSLANSTHAIVLTQHPFHNAQLKYQGILDDSVRQAYYYGYESIRAMPSQNTTKTGVIFYATIGNNYYALNKLPSILDTYITYTNLGKEFWAILGTPINLTAITDSYLNELKSRNIINIELQFINTATYTTNCNWTLTNTQIQTLLSNLIGKGFKTWFYITTNFEASRTDAKNKYFDSLIKTTTQQNVSVDFAVLNPDPTYSWGTQILSDVEYIKTTFANISGFFIDDFGYYGDRLDYNANHSPKYYDPNTSTRNATSLSFGIANLMQQLRTKEYPLVVNSPTHVEEFYYADGGLLWDFPVDSGTALYLRYSTLHWTLPKEFLKTGISSDVGNVHNTDNNLYYNLSFWTNGQIYPFGYNDADNTVFYANKTQHHIQNAWFLEQPAEYAYGNGQTLKIQNSDTRLAIFGQSSSGTITSDTNIDIYTKSGALIASSTKSKSLDAYLTGEQDIFVIKQSQTDPYVALSQSSKISSESYSGGRLSFIVTSPSTSTTKVYVGDKGEPQIVEGATSWNYDETTKIATITKLHSSPATITLMWTGIPNVSALLIIANFNTALSILGLAAIIVMCGIIVAAFKFGNLDMPALILFIGVTVIIVLALVVCNLAFVSLF